MLLTVFTPVYNRGALLRRAYESLCRQTDMDFEWLVVDDGSTDDTPAVIDRIVAEHSAPFAIRVVRTVNGGKHRAVNVGVKEACGEWFTILDSDDYLVDDAVAVMRGRLADVSPADGIAGLVALRIHPDGKTVGTSVDFESRDLHHEQYRVVLGIEGDRAEVVATDVMRRYRFPEFPGEKFVREGPVWQQIGTDYLMRYTNDPIYVCDYQADGLTAKVALLHERNPMGAAWANAKALELGHMPLLKRVKRVAQWKRWTSRISDTRYITPLPRHVRRLLVFAPVVNLLRSLVRSDA